MNLVRQIKFFYHNDITQNLLQVQSDTTDSTYFKSFPGGMPPDPPRISMLRNNNKCNPVLVYLSMIMWDSPTDFVLTIFCYSGYYLVNCLATFTTVFEFLKGRGCCMDKWPKLPCGL